MCTPLLSSDHHAVVDAHGHQNGGGGGGGDWLVDCLMTKQHANVSNGRIFSDNRTCYHTEIEVAYLLCHQVAVH